MKDKQVVKHHNYWVSFTEEWIKHDPQYMQKHKARHIKHLALAGKAKKFPTTLLFFFFAYTSMYRCSDCIENHRIVESMRLEKTF